MAASLSRLQFDNDSFTELGMSCSVNTATNWTWYGNLHTIYLRWNVCQGFHRTVTSYYPIKQDIQLRKAIFPVHCPKSHFPTVHYFVKQLGLLITRFAIIQWSIKCEHWHKLNKSHPISRPHDRGTECQLWVIMIIVVNIDPVTKIPSSTNWPFCMNGPFIYFTQTDVVMASLVCVWLARYSTGCYCIHLASVDQDHLTVDLTLYWTEI